MVARRTDTMVCNSEYSAGLLRKVVGPKADVRVIYNSVPTRARLKKSDAPNINPQRFNIVYIGRIKEAKGVEFLLEAGLELVKRHENVDLYLVGEYEWKNAFAERLVRKVKTLEVDNRILFTGEVEDVYGVLQSAHVHVCPSISPSESFPNVILEAKSVGVPSIVFPIAGLPEAVLDGVEGTVCETCSSQALTQTIEKYIADDALKQKHGRAAKQSLARFNEERIAKLWARLIEERSCEKHC